MAQRASFAQLHRAREGERRKDRRQGTIPDGGLRSALATAPELTPGARRDPRQPTWVDGDPSTARIAAAAIAARPEEPTVIVEGEHWTEEDGALGALETLAGPMPSVVDPSEVEDVDDFDDLGEEPATYPTHPTAWKPSAPAPGEPDESGIRESRKRGSVWTEVEARYRAEGHWSDLVELYLQRLDRTSDAKERAGLLARIGAVLRDHLDDPAQAQEAYVEALLLVPTDAGVVESVAGLARRLRGLAPVMQAIGAELDEIDLQPDGKERQLALCELLVTWANDEVGDRAAAERYVARMRAIDPTHPLVHRRQASVYREQGRWDAQRDELTRALLSARRPGEKSAVHVALGELAEARFGDLVAATTHYEEALRADPRCVGALSGMERVCRVQERFVDLVQILETRVEVEQDEDERTSARMRLAEVHELHFVKPQLAAEHLEEVLATSPGHAEALTALERCYRAMRAWHALVRILEVRAQVAKNRTERVDAMLAQAEVLEGKTGDVDAALAAYRHVYDLDDRHEGALTELARLSEKAQDWTGAAAYRGRLAELAEAKEQKARIHVGIGEMLAPAGRDPGAARAHFEKAVALDPTCASAWEALEKEARAAGDVDRLTIYLEKRVAHMEAGRLSAQLLVELGKVHAGLGEQSSATRAFERAIQADPTNEVAAEAMLAHYTNVGRWSEAEPLCELLVTAAIRDGHEDRTFELLQLATRIACETKSDERALVAALAAFRARAVKAAKEDLVAVCHRLRAQGSLIARARAELDALAAATDGLSVAHVAKLADVRRALGDDAGALALFDQVLAADGEHPTALAGLAELYVARQDWERASSYKMKLAHTAIDEAEHFTLLVDAGELWAHRAKNLPMAALAYEEALTLRPKDHWLLHTLLWVYGELQCWSKLEETLRAVSELETDGARKAKSIFTMAQVAREKRGDAAQAAALFEETLDLDPRRLEAFEQVVRIHTELRDWNELKAAYGRMLRRLKSDGDVELRHALFFQLGLIFRDRLGDAGRALDAFRAADRLKPGTEEIRKIVCELLVVGGRIDEAVATARGALRKKAQEPAIFLELYDLSCRQHAFDRAWCALDAAVALGGTLTAEQARFYDDFPPARLRDVPGTLTAVAWPTHVLHADLEAALTGIFAIVTPAVLRARLALASDSKNDAWLTKSLGEPLTPEGPTAIAVLDVVKNASEVLGVPCPVLHARKPSPVPLAPSMEGPAMFVSLEACEALPPDALAFVVGKRLAEQRPELVARALFPSVTELNALLEMALALVASPDGTGAPPAGASVAFYKALAASLGPDDRRRLRDAVAAARAMGAELDVERWSQLADVSASRAGLLLAGRASAARRAMLLDAQSPGDLTPRERLAELLTFAVSDEYGDLRQAIGVGVPST